MSNKFENIFKSDIYSLGMVVLSAATLENISTFYNFEENTLNL